MGFPVSGRPVADVLADLSSLTADDVDWKGGRVFSLSYYPGDEAYALAEEAYRRFLGTNALNPSGFPSVARVQRDLVSWMADLLNGGTDAAGFLTAGGTESLLLAMKAARNRGRDRGITNPNVVLPVSAHGSFNKAGEYFGVELRRTAVRSDWRADIDAVADAIDDDTVLLVGSAPQYPQGVIDPIGEIATLAAERDILCHVDACMGGITLPCLERLGHRIPEWDFRVRGVTSISADLHKYGYTPKGCGVLLWRDKELRRYQTFHTTDWLGGHYATSGILGSRGGGAWAAAWAMVSYQGLDGLCQLTAAARRATERLLAGLRAIGGVHVLAEPDATHVAFTFDDVDTFAVGGALRDRGWFCDEQSPPPSLHCTVMANHEATVDAFVAAVVDAQAEIAGGGAVGEQKPYGST